MGVMNRFLNFIGMQEEEEYTEREKVASHDDYEQEVEAPVFDQHRKSAKGANIVSIHSQKASKVVLYEPRSYDEAQEIADHLRSRRSVVINLQRIRNDQALRIIDFLSGTVYALSGNISKIGSNIFLCVPEHIEVQGSITEMFSEELDYNQMR
ncbi:cell division protein SepF [Paenibacillus sp. ACRRX]|uniref:cell division protein SepF n=1 Tax=Paenibacillus TaxID=44249 RepID=UPI000418515B|nr:MULTISPECIES: cell division protein SepF [Paenibacillus]MCG7407784.1 cell division protein SepF [Paenibacillus sp. ACRRX]MDK8180928.1 cell division protein SepF [Paenibacillus sp. UMB4589-SE434]